MVQKRKEELVSKLAGCGLLLTSHGYERMMQCSLDLDTIIKAAKERGQWLISNEFLVEFFQLECSPKRLAGEEELKIVGVETEAGPPLDLRVPEPVVVPAQAQEAPESACGPEPLVVVVEKGRRIHAKETESRLVIDKASDVTGKSTCEGKLEDFVEYFNNKYGSLRDMIRLRENYSGAIPIEHLSRYKGEVSSVIGMVRDKRESKNGYRFLEIEDPTGEITVLFPGDNGQLSELYNSILPDQVVGVQGRLNNELLVASDIVEPDLPIARKINYAEEPVHAVLLSDIHVGSNLFLEKEFNSFVDWLNLRGEQADVAEKVKYVLVAGDLVDGVGIYPGQEQELTIPDIYKQYDYLATLLESFPDYVEVVLSVGNHDASRNAEPQPALSNEVAGRLYDMENLHLTGNPVSLSMHGVRTLMYHGTTMDTLIGNLKKCSYQQPEKAMIEYLRKRHLAPKYGEDSISPEKRDYMVVREVPDIFHSGHVHTNGYGTYRGVKVINSGTWQARTKYQEQQGHIPTPARVPVINLQSHELSVIHFGNE